MNKAVLLKLEVLKDKFNELKHLIENYKVGTNASTNGLIKQAESELKRFTSSITKSNNLKTIDPGLLENIKDRVTEIVNTVKKAVMRDKQWQEADEKYKKALVEDIELVRNSITGALARAVRSIEEFTTRMIAIAKIKALFEKLRDEWSALQIKINDLSKKIVGLKEQIQDVNVTIQSKFAQAKADLIVLIQNYNKKHGTSFSTSFVEDFIQRKQQQYLGEQFPTSDINHQLAVEFIQELKKVEEAKIADEKLDEPQAAERRKTLQERLAELQKEVDDKLDAIDIEEDVNKKALLVKEYEIAQEEINELQLQQNELDGLLKQTETSLDDIGDMEEQVQELKDEIERLEIERSKSTGLAERDRFGEMIGEKNGLLTSINEKIEEVIMQQESLIREDGDQSNMAEVAVETKGMVGAVPEEVVVETKEAVEATSEKLEHVTDGGTLILTEEQVQKLKDEVVQLEIERSRISDLAKRDQLSESIGEKNGLLRSHHEALEKSEELQPAEETTMEEDPGEKNNSSNIEM